MDDVHGPPAPVPEPNDKGKEREVAREESDGEANDDSPVTLNGIRKMMKDVMGKVVGDIVENAVQRRLENSSFSPQKKSGDAPRKRAQNKNLRKKSDLDKEKANDLPWQRKQFCVSELLRACFHKAEMRPANCCQGFQGEDGGGAPRGLCLA